ncbi:hypothetical protein A5735_16780 [Mycolicibacter heraklionensis]|nr:hypothetical protein A5735_16780 [Mycolicibacter heraklionensis]
MATQDFALTGGLDDRRVPIAEARAQLSAVIKRAADGDIMLVSHGRPAAVLMSPEHYRALLDELDELQDRLAVWENRDAPTVSFDFAMTELGIADDVNEAAG